MSEMTRRLRERRAKAENNTQVSRLSQISIVIFNVCFVVIFLLYGYHSVKLVDKIVTFILELIPK